MSHQKNSNNPQRRAPQNPEVVYLTQKKQEIDAVLGALDVDLQKLAIQTSNATTLLRQITNRDELLYVQGKRREILRQTEALELQYSDVLGQSNNVMSLLEQHKRPENHAHLSQETQYGSGHSSERYQRQLDQNGQAALVNNLKYTPPSDASRQQRPFDPAFSGEAGYIDPRLPNQPPSQVPQLPPPGEPQHNAQPDSRRRPDARDKHNNPDNSKKPPLQGILRTSENQTDSKVSNKTPTAVIRDHVVPDEYRDHGAQHAAMNYPGNAHPQQQQPVQQPLPQNLVQRSRNTQSHAGNRSNNAPESPYPNPLPSPPSSPPHLPRRAPLTQQGGGHPTLHEMNLTNNSKQGRRESIYAAPIPFIPSIERNLNTKSTSTKASGDRNNTKPSERSNDVPNHASLTSVSFHQPTLTSDSGDLQSMSGNPMYSSVRKDRVATNSESRNVQQEQIGAPLPPPLPSRLSFTQQSAGDHVGNSAHHSASIRNEPVYGDAEGVRNQQTAVRHQPPTSDGSSQHNRSAHDEVSDVLPPSSSINSSHTSSSSSRFNSLS